MFLPSQSDGLLEAVGLDHGDVEAAAWALRPSGDLLGGAAAILAALDELVPRGARLFSLPLRSGAAAAVADAAYAKVARNRGRLPGEATCAVGPPPAIDAATASEISRRRPPRRTAIP